VAEVLANAAADQGRPPPTAEQCGQFGRLLGGLAHDGSEPPPRKKPARRRRRK
jgi:hypothetical protein